MSDMFRRYQQSECANGGGDTRRYGCHCCRKYGNLNKHKKYARRRARVKLRRKDRGLS